MKRGGGGDEKRKQHPAFVWQQPVQRLRTPSSGSALPSSFPGNRARPLSVQPCSCEWGSERLGFTSVDFAHPLASCGLGHQKSYESSRVLPLVSNCT